MNPEQAMERFASMQGWSVEAQLSYALNYIANQCDDPAFEDYLQQQADEENSHE